MNQFQIQQENIPLVFAHIRDRLKYQAKIISGEYSIKRSAAYEILAILWGFESWYSMNDFLKKVEEVHLRVAQVIAATASEKDTSKCLILLSRIKRHIDDYNANKSPERLLPMQGIYQSLKSLPVLKERLSEDRNKSRYDSLKELEGYLGSYLQLFNHILLSTSCLKNREFVCSDLATIEYQMFVRYNRDNRVCREFGALVDMVGNNKISYLFSSLSPKLFGIDYDVSGLELNQVYGRHPMLGKAGNPFGSDALYDYLRDHGCVTLTLRQLLDLFGPVDSNAINQTCDDGFLTVGICIAHLPDDALVTIVASTGLGRPDNHGSSTCLNVTAVSVRDKRQLPALMACVNFQEVRPFIGGTHPGRYITGMDVESYYSSGYTYHYEFLRCESEARLQDSF